jgi:hypothetical protein
MVFIITTDAFADIQDVEWFATEQERDQSFKEQRK